MVRVRNRIVVFSHQDRFGRQLRLLVRGRVEEDIKREEAEIEREEDGGDDEGSGVAMTARLHVKGPTKLSAVRAAPGIPRYKIVISNKSVAAIPKPTATTTMGRPVVGNGGRGTKAAGTAAVPENKKSGSTGMPAVNNSVGSGAGGSNPQANANAGGVNLAGPNGQAPTDRPVGDFAFALVANLYHKRRESLLRFIEALGGDPSAMAD
jgi:hypothetical protein